MIISKKYLSIPIRTGADICNVEFDVGQTRAVGVNIGSNHVMYDVNAGNRKEN